ncbi:uncharacterized protein LOC121837307 [Ixodes scapularis]|uniref:uncharacterized protein LOC121837307 n=1 Tax=Ixodes scapularis TaxID=6945 RepID=UPI001C394819|nr:uncharacterized protein LOC121837307 [Ixodes scapularis]
MFLVLLLLLSGDVELNPGPPTKAEQMTKIETMLEGLTVSMANVTIKLSTIESKQEEFEKKLDNLLKSNDHLEKRVADFEDQNKRIEEHIDDLENRSRRCNLVFYGISDGKRNETWEESKNHVVQICNDIMEINPASIQRAHRIGYFKDGFKRPVIVNFMSWTEKEDILHSGFKFKNTDFSVSEDFSNSLREKRRNLWSHSKQIRQDKSNKVHLSYDKLVVNGDVFIWDAERKEAVPVRRKRGTRPQQ